MTWFYIHREKLKGLNIYINHKEKPTEKKRMQERTSEKWLRQFNFTNPVHPLRNPGYVQQA